jgi:putative PIN family toxin of toxin-antitoxin system
VNVPLVVYDTMVFFQAASRPDRTRATFRAIREKRVTLILSPELLAEIQDVLNRDNMRAKFPALTSDAVKVFIDDVLAHCTMFETVARAFNWPQHPDDDHLFDLAICSKAKYLVTWETRILRLATDKTPAADLLRRLAPDLDIVTPKQLADLLGSSG